MPFQSEKQRRYLWANEPEIARDWTETYGSRVENNMGGIMRLGFANGPNWQVAEENDDENYLEKFIRFMQGNAGELSKEDVIANKNFIGNMQFSPNNPYAMTSGPFQGMNAPGTSALGSKTPQEMAQKWMEKYGEMNYQTPKMQQKQQQIKNIATMNQAPPGKDMATGGIMRLGYFTGALADTAEGQAMSPGTTAGGEFRSGPENMNQGNTGYQDQIMLGATGIKPEPKKNWLGTGIAGLRGILPFLGEKGTLPGVALSIYDIINQEPDIDDMVLSADDETTDDETLQEKLAKKITHMDDFIEQQKLKKQANIFKELGLE